MGATLTRGKASPYKQALNDEKIRQLRQAFDQKRRQSDRWFQLRLAMGYTAVVLLASVIVICALILFNASSHSEQVVTLAATALLVDVIGLLIGVWKIAFRPEASERAEPLVELWDLAQETD